MYASTYLHAYLHAMWTHSSACIHRHKIRIYTYIRTYLMRFCIQARPEYALSATRNTDYRYVCVFVCVRACVFESILSFCVVFCACLYAQKYMVYFAHGPRHIRSLMQHFCMHLCLSVYKQITTCKPYIPERLVRLLVLQSAQ